MKRLLITTALLTSATSAWADCPAVTMQDRLGVDSEYRQQVELSVLQQTAGCTLTFSDNPAIEELNARIQGNGNLPPVAERLPEEPLVVIPFDSIGHYGGVLDGMSNATESGTSDLLSLRHVNLVRFSDDFQTIDPEIAKDYQWNNDFTELTLHLRKGHKWSDGEPFTSDDILFWFYDLENNPDVMEHPRSVWVSGGEPIKITAPDAQTVVFSSKEPMPGLLVTLARDYAQPFQPKHFLSQFMTKYNPEADALAKEYGFENGYEVIKFYYGNSDWKDVPSPLLKDPAKAAAMPRAVVPTLESHIVVEDSTENRRVVANPYFFMVDTTGQQLPYINEINERYVSNNEVRLLKLVNGEIDYKRQDVYLPDVSTLLDSAEKGDYQIILRPEIDMPVISFNVTDEDEEKRAVFAEKNFRIAMSHAINREEINSAAYFDLGSIAQYMAFSPVPEFADEAQKKLYTDFDPDKAMAMLDALGLKDSDGDGARELPSGRKFTLQIQFATQGMPAQMAELIANEWTNIGIPTAIKEITSDEYRSLQSSNKLEVGAWAQGNSVANNIAFPQPFVVPFGIYTGHRVGMLWAKYIDSDGAEGIAPPQWTKDLEALALEWQTYPLGSEKSAELGHELIDGVQDSFLFIGTVQAVDPIYVSNHLHNFDVVEGWSATNYSMYPNIPQQWWLDE